MSLTNAIASISVVGAILMTGEKDAPTLSRVLGFIAVVSATTNLVSGYLITDRMLKMFKKREPEKNELRRYSVCRFSISLAAVCFILALEMDVVAGHGAARRDCRAKSGC